MLWGTRLAVLVVVVSMAAGTAAGCRAGSGETATPSPATTSPATSPPGASPSPLEKTATPVPNRPREIAWEAVLLPQPPEVTRQLPAPPQSPFPLWDGKSTVIYDTHTGKATDLGPGSQQAYFSPDETKAVWAAGGEFAQGTEVFIIDLVTGQKRSLGPGRLISFADNTHVAVVAIDGNDRELIDVATGKRQPFSGEVWPALVPPVPSAPPGYAIEPRGGMGPALQKFTISDASTGKVLWSFEAVGVAAAGTDQIAIASPPSNGASQIFIMNLRTGDMSFVARAQIGKDNWPYSASEKYVLWTDNYCGSGPISLFDRASGELTRFDLSEASEAQADLRWVVLTPANLLAAGSFGATYLIDPVSLEYRAVIPGTVEGYTGNVSWSANYRYASHGPFGGHGGLCAPG